MLGTAHADYLIQEDDKLETLDLNAFAPGKTITIRATHADGSHHDIVCRHTYIAGQIEWFKAGSALNLIKQQAAV